MEYINSFRFLGVEARQVPCLSGAGAPAIPAATGELYLDTTTGDLYKGIGGEWRPLNSSSTYRRGDNSV